MRLPTVTARSCDGSRPTSSAPSRGVASSPLRRVADLTAGQLLLVLANLGRPRRPSGVAAYAEAILPDVTVAVSATGRGDRPAGRRGRVAGPAPTSTGGRPRR